MTVLELRVKLNRHSGKDIVMLESNEGVYHEITSVEEKQLYSYLDDPEVDPPKQAVIIGWLEGA